MSTILERREDIFNPRYADQETVRWERGYIHRRTGRVPPAAPPVKTPETKDLEIEYAKTREYVKEMVQAGKRNPAIVKQIVGSEYKYSEKRQLYCMIHAARYATGIGLSAQVGAKRIAMLIDVRDGVTFEDMRVRHKCKTVRALKAQLRRFGVPIPIGGSRATLPPHLVNELDKRKK